MTVPCYPYTLSPLPYAYDALEPFLDAKTLHFHHDKHLGTYIENLNKALAPYPRLQSLSLTELLAQPQKLPEKARCAILRNGGGVYNHLLYFEGLAPAGEDVHAPRGRLLALIERCFGGFEQMKEALTKEALAVFGSGWAVLTLTRNGSLRIVTLKNQDTVIPLGLTPLLTVDVWEHAYYLEYQNRRAEYVKNMWELLVFPVI